MAVHCRLPPPVFHMTTIRVPIPQDMAARILFEAHLTCCVCRARGRPIQIHHLDGEHSNSLDESNLVVLCLLCHDETMVKGGVGRKLNAEVLEKYKKDWLERVRQTRDDADRVSFEVTGFESVASPSAQTVKPSGHPAVPVSDYISLLPRLRKRAYAESREGWASGVTYEMLHATNTVIAVMEDVLSTLAMYYPHSHFTTENPRNFMQGVIQQRFDWHRLQMQPEGDGRHGTIVIPMIAGAVLHDLETMVRDMVSSLTLDWSGETTIFEDWVKNWDEDTAGPTDDLANAASGLLSGDPRTFNRRISLTDADDDGFIGFLDRNHARVVFLNAVLDACVATGRQHLWMEALIASGLDVDRLWAGQLDGLVLPLDVGDPPHVTVTFNLLPGHTLLASAGGTGVLTMDLRGFFEVTQTFHSGPTTAFHLREVAAPMETLAERLRDSPRLE